MKIEVNLGKDFGRNASISFEDSETRGGPISLSPARQEDLNTLLKVFGGLVVSVIEDTASTKKQGEPELIDEVLDVIEKFAKKRVQAAVQEKKSPSVH